MKERKDDFKSKRTHLQKMRDTELKAYFYQLADKIVDPLLDLSVMSTTKSIERSVLLRMGFSSIEAKAIVDKLNEYNLLRKGAGHCIYKLSKEKNLTIRDAGHEIVDKDGVDYLLEVFRNNG